VFGKKFLFMQVNSYLEQRLTLVAFYVSTIVGEIFKRKDEEQKGNLVLL
jgi:hypothetical protein